MAQSITWVQEFLTKVASKRSPLTYVCTNDARRFGELTQLLAHKVSDGGRYSKSVIIYDGWAGVNEYEMDSDAYKKVDVPVTTDMLEYIYSLLNYETSDNSPQPRGNSVVMKNFDAPMFLRFFVYVSQDFKLFRKHSNLIILVDDVSQVPAELIERVNVVDITTLPEEREKVVAEQLKRMKTEGDVVRISRALSGLNLDQTEAALVGSMAKFKCIDMSYLQQQKREVIARRGNLTLLDSHKGFESVGGYSYIKAFLNDFVILPMRHPQEAARMGVDLPKGCLVFGIEGTGKTLIAKCLGKELDMPVVQFHAGQLRGKYVGETEQKTRSAIKAIEELSPCVVFVDEIEHTGYRPTGQNDSGVSLNQFTMLLSFMSDSHGSFLFGTTNDIGKLDPAFMRAGRLDYYLPMMLPDEEARAQIFHVHASVVRNVPMSKDVDVSKVVGMTAWYNGAEIELLVKTAGAMALRDYLKNGKKGKMEVRMEHIIQALDERKVDVEDRKKRTAVHKATASGLCPKGIMNEAFKMSEDAQKTASADVLREYER